MKQKKTFYLTSPAVLGWGCTLSILLAACGFLCRELWAGATVATVFLLLLVLLIAYFLTHKITVDVETKSFVLGNGMVRRLFFREVRKVVIDAREALYSGKEFIFVTEGRRFRIPLYRGLGGVSCERSLDIFAQMRQMTSGSNIAFFEASPMTDFELVSRNVEGFARETHAALLRGLGERYEVFYHPFMERMEPVTNEALERFRRVRDALDAGDDERMAELAAEIPDLYTSAGEFREEYLDNFTTAVVFPKGYVPGKEYELAELVGDVELRFESLRYDSEINVTSYDAEFTECFTALALATGDVEEVTEAL